MGYILVRNERIEFDNETPQDLHIPEFNIIVKNCILGEGVNLWANVNIYGCRIGAECKIGNFVEIRPGVTLGERCKLEPFVFIPEGVSLGKGVFIGPNVTFTNDLYPRSCTNSGELIQEYEITETVVKDYASIGAGSVVLCGVTIGERAMAGAGSLVAKDMADDELVYGQRAVSRGAVK
ncbi:acyltransferase [Limisalsivibrio acetivorans]|uniref:acyltransferase n=1 Tax=Limisalsivibrio acetivorans TaxID=1304888 RepID=UPI0003B7B433|nr:acyltransferase [Limisalsivibrio acetivorans]